MCNEGMCEKGDVDMTMQQKGGTYRPADFKKLLGTMAKNWKMLVDGSNDKLKSGAAEILVLSRMKDITQTPPEDFRDIPVIVADGVEYVLLDQLADFMKKNADDRNVIHETLHEALQGQDLIEFVPARTEDNTISSRPLWGELLSAALERLGAVNLVSDESEDVGARENVDGEGGTFEEQQPQPVKSFDSSRKLAALIFSTRGGVGKRNRARMTESQKSNTCGAGAKWSYVGTKPVTGPRMENKDEEHRREVVSEPLLPLTSERSLKVVGKKDKGRKKCKADKKKDRREHRRSGSKNEKTEQTSSRRNASKVSLPSSQREISKLKERNESPPATPASRNRDSGVENRSSKAPEKRSREDGMLKVHRRTKNRITQKKNRMVEMIDLRGSGDMHSAAREEAEEEHDQSISEKSDWEENEATSDEGGESETSDGHSRDTHDADDEDGRSSDGTAQDEGGDGADEDDRSTDGRESSPSPGRTRCTREPESGDEGGAADAPSIDRQLVRHDDAVQNGKQNVLQLLLLHNDYVVTAQSDGISLMRGCRCDERTVETGSGISQVHRRTKKRITYKKDRMVEMIDLRISDNMQSASREEAEEEHDQSISEKSDGEKNEATSDEGGDSETSDEHSRDTHDADDEDGRSSDGIAQDKGGDGAGEDDRTVDGRESSPSPRRTRRTREPESGGEGDAADSPSIDRQIVRHDNAVQKGKQNVLQLFLLHNDYEVTAQSDGISLMRECRCDERTVETGC
ncbi:hypothetical protein CBR_g32720 [Chara braunii]|uniref:Uncharacterized protein n=1 Tax=Chara braunii TaxID=69332 RepID=A0A388LHD3_CHABU|nr:hypothetical protein CBR_g32720 [Chara braunii]|eukprot:GBG81728.1 hypothetical protein CBR_g32720 [Chara braunii]